MCGECKQEENSIESKKEGIKKEAVVKDFVVAYCTRCYCQGNHPNTIYSQASPKELWYPSKSTSTYDYHQGRSMGSQNGIRLPGYVIIDANQRNEPYPHDIHQPRHYNPGPQDNFHNWPANNNHYNYPTENHHHDHHWQACFQRQYPTMKLHPSITRSMYELPTVMECERMCSSASFNCKAYSFQYRPQFADSGANCYLTDVNSLSPYHDLISDSDCDVYMRMPTCQNVFTVPTTECFSQVAMGVRMSPTVLRLSVSVMTLTDCELECLRADFFICRSFIFRANDPRDNCMLSDRSLKTIDHSSFYRSPGDLLYERGSFGRGCEYDVGPPYLPPTDVGFQRPYIPRDMVRDTWQHFTVRGWPCRRGTQCTINKDAGFWSCEVEGGDYAQWDYCCKPQHACGYSKGYNYPWCYVGEAGPDQWRPCSEHYYPNYQQPQPPMYLPSKPSSSNSLDYFGPPMFWPMSYIYSESPPNETSIFQPMFTPFDDHNSYDDSPRIQFKPSPTLANYPKGIIQKLDEKDKPTPEVPHEEELSVNINPRNNFAKKLKTPDYVFATSGSFGNASFLPTPLTENTVKEQSLVEFMSAVNKLNETLLNKSSSKTKDILEMVEKIILASKTEKPVICEKTHDSIKESVTNTTSSSVVQPPIVEKQETAMARFWNWSQENYFKKDLIKI